MLQKLHGESDMDWSEIAEEYECGCSSDHLRKMAQGLKLAEEAGLLGEENVIAAQTADDDQEERLKSLLREVQYERVRLRDERTALAAKNRNEARLESKLDILEAEIRKAGMIRYPEAYYPTDAGECHLLVPLGDVHYGAFWHSMGGGYDTGIAIDRVLAYAKAVAEYAIESAAEKVTVVLLGDMISGNIHKEISITNRETVICQVMEVSELVAKFISIIANAVPSVHLWSVSGNHSRIDRKEDAVHDERLDDIVTWYVKAALARMDNVHVHTVEENLDTSLAAFTIYDKLIYAVHGDYDKLDEASIARLTSITGEKPDVIMTAHRHTSAFELGETTILQNGSICGSGDGFTVARRLIGKAKQVIYRMTDAGVTDMKIIVLQ